ncbi:MAG: MmcQ/YjbR family DNA-binding protein [Lentimicrobiaceae bacterium]|jgi:predicted DNA-binding protein (MmcQ/YjbR family)|nr:MmcQ/YjbR family DNA-binding protein [Lentimicrobiaceae bacterium]
MNIEELRNYCISKPYVEECFPFDETTLVFKVGGKMFLLTDLDGDLYMIIKAKPESVIERIERYSDTDEGFHMNKKHWIRVRLENNLDIKRIENWIDESYRLVFDSLPKRKREELNTLL